MISPRLYFDKRNVDRNGLHTLYLAITKKGKTAMTSLDVKLTAEQWKDGKVVHHPQSQLLNTVISTKKAEWDRAILELTLNGTLTNKSVKECLTILLDHLDPEKAEARKTQDARKRSFGTYFRKHIESKSNKGTKQLYLDTYYKIIGYCNESSINLETLAFEDIKKSWLTSFEQYCLKTEAQNTASRHLRDIRAVFNSAIDDELTTNYPFRKFKIRKADTVDKSYTAEELRRLFDFNSIIPGEQESIEMFKLMFCLIGINSIDLYKCGKPVKGRIKYTRTKTGKLYSIKLEPEALAIIEKYKGKDSLVNIKDRCANYETYFRRMSKNLKKVGKIPVLGKKSVGDALLPDICTGSARTSWATIAQEELDIPREIIAAALGHHTVDVTSTYLRTNWRDKVDAANRKVLDWVFHGISEISPKK